MKDQKGKIYDELYNGIKYYAFQRPNKSNTTTWDNAKTYDNSTTLYENILKENILKENELKEDIKKEKVLKEKKK